jgi:hypothetical protein
MESHADPIAGSPPAPFAPTGLVGEPSVGPVWAGRLLFAGIVLVIGLPVAAAGRFIWAEWQELQEEERRAEATTVVGYPNIYPKVSWALRPEPWFRIEGDSALVWSGWKPGQGHGWFRVNAGEIERRKLGEPLGRDISQAIDYPMIENGGGVIWERIPEAAAVAGLSLGGCSCAYPMGVLMKVLIVNDVVDDRPYLVHYDPFVRPEAKVAIYDASVDGRRITLGSSGLLLDGRHVLYDRGTESLWVDDGRALAAFAGKYKGKRLTVVSRVDPVPWEGWRDGHPGARLVVGSAERTRALPTE